MQILAQLPAEQKPARVKALIKRLFRSDAVDLAASEQEKVASLFEDALIAHHQGQELALEPRLKDIFADNTTKSLAIKKRIDDGTMGDPSLGFVIALLRKLLADELGRANQQHMSFLQAFKSDNQNLQQYTNISSKIQPALFSFVSRELNACILEPTLHATEIPVVTKNNESVQHLINFSKDPEYYNKNMRNTDELFFFNQGLVSDEIEKRIQSKLEYYKDVCQVPGLIPELQTMLDNKVDFKQLSELLEAEVRAFIKPAQAPGTNALLMFGGPAPTAAPTNAPNNDPNNNNNDNVVGCRPS